jgi:hypothetical protein
VVRELASDGKAQPGAAEGGRGFGWLNSSNSFACTEIGLPGWAYTIRTGESVRNPSRWNCMTIAAQAGRQRPLACQLHDTDLQLSKISADDLARKADSFVSIESELQPPAGFAGAWRMLDPSSSPSANKKNQTALSPRYCLNTVDRAASLP